MKPSASTARAVARAVAGPSHLPFTPLAALSARPTLVGAASATSPSSPFGRPATARSFFSLPDISKLAGLVPGATEAAAGVDSSGEEQRFHARKILPYTPAQLYELVSDVPAYSQFIPFCTSSTVLGPDGRPAADWTPGREPFSVHAELAVGFGGLEERYISKVVGVPFESVSATASKRTPLFKNLVTTWSFAPAHPARPGEAPGSSGPTLLTIDLTFAFANPLHRIASQAVLPRVADKMVEAFEARAGERWGKP